MTPQLVSYIDQLLVWDNVLLQMKLSIAFRNLQMTLKLQCQHEKYIECVFVCVCVKKQTLNADPW